MDRIMQQKILSHSVIGTGKFLVLKDLSFQDDRGCLRHWEAVDRDGEASAVFIIARIVPDDEILLVRQFRPPTGRLMLEFPAGLIDPGETPAETAVRELYEETGHHGKVISISLPGYSSPGLTGEAISLVTMEIDGDACRNQLVTPHPEDSECIECFRVPRVHLAEFVKRQEAEGVGIDSKIYTMLVALQF